MPAEMIPYKIPCFPAQEMALRAVALRDAMNGRRSCRYFSDRDVSREVLETVLSIAHSAPSGANRKPWRFVVVGDPECKRKIREAAEAEERESYGHRMPPEWLEALEPLGTTAEKPFLEIAPWLVVMFRIDWEEQDGTRLHNYYPAESAGIAAGFFLMACHQVGLATLTHTPSPMGFLREILGRPAGEKPFLLIPVGYPAEDCTVPDIPKKPLNEALEWREESGQSPEKPVL